MRYAEVGFDIHAHHACKMISTNSSLGKVLTLGRQELHLPSEYTKKILTPDQQKKFAEDFILSAYDAETVESLDANGYEKPTFIHDLNMHVKNSSISHLIGKFDTVIDIGTIEHVFNLPTALSNASKLTKANGGTLLHILVANNCMGHGFYQISPELFFSAYREENGFRNTEIYLAEVFDYSHWYKVEFTRGERVELGTSSPTYIIVKTNVQSHVELDSWKVQQSDYEETWKNSLSVKHQEYANENSSSCRDILPEKIKALYNNRIRNIGKSFSLLSWKKHKCLRKINTSLLYK